MIKEFERYIDFVTSVSDMPFCVDAWQLKPKLAGAAYCARKGLPDQQPHRVEEDSDTDIREISRMGVKHVLLAACNMADAFLATAAFSETKELPEDQNHPLYRLFPEFVEQLKSTM